MFPILRDLDADHAAEESSYDRLAADEEIRDEPEMGDGRPFCSVSHIEDARSQKSTHEASKKNREPHPLF